MTTGELLSSLSTVSDVSAITHLQNISLAPGADVYVDRYSANIIEEVMNANVIDVYQANIIDETLKANLIEDITKANIEEETLKGDIVC